MAEQEGTREEIDVLSADELRDAAGVLPELDGFTLWHKKVLCDYCYSILGTDVLVLQKSARSGLSFMCLSCTKRLFSQLTD